MVRQESVRVIAAAIILGIGAAVAPHLVSHAAPRSEASIKMAPGVGMPGGPPTSSSGLQQRITEMEGRLQNQPTDLSAAVLLSDALLRLARATNDGRPANRASTVLSAMLKENPGQYDALRMLGAIDLSQHRFREALEIGQRARDERPDDAWNYGVIGDALIELGEYDKAFDAFDKMMSLRPSAAAYARVSYARELRGDLTGASDAMRLASGAAPPQDLEAQAWYSTQLAELSLKRGQLEEADREYRRANFFYPNYPLAMVGRGKVKVEQGRREEALEIYLDQLKRTPTIDLASRIGDLYADRGNAAEAERYYQLAEDVAGPGLAQTEAALALFLADHNRKLGEAVRIAEGIAAMRHDIFTDDTLAWAYFKTGRIGEAYSASLKATRTGSRDARILGHAAAILEARSSHRS
jgi:tetratricopeptide (TPR) repeat protein